MAAGGCGAQPEARLRRTAKNTGSGPQVGNFTDEILGRAAPSARLLRMNVEATGLLVVPPDGMD
jgi:hypothetical protein